MLMMELAVGIAELILVGAVIFGVLYAVGMMAEIFDGLVSVSTAVLGLFTIAGVLLYKDFRPSESTRQSEKKKSASSYGYEINEHRSLKSISAR